MNNEWLEICKEQYKKTGSIESTAQALQIHIISDNLEHPDRRKLVSHRLQELRVYAETAALQIINEEKRG